MSESRLRDPVRLAWLKCFYDVVDGCSPPESPSLSLWPQLSSTQHEESVHKDRPDWKGNCRSSEAFKAQSKETMTLRLSDEQRVDVGAGDVLQFAEGLIPA